MAEESSTFCSWESWISSSNMGLICNNKCIISSVFNSSVDCWTVEWFWNRWEHLCLQKGNIFLLGDKFSDFSADFLTDLNSLCIGILRVESWVHDSGNELCSLTTFQDSWVCYGEFLSTKSLINICVTYHFFK